MLSDARSVASLIKQAESRIAEQVELVNSTPALEARILFEHVSGKPRSWQMAHSNESVVSDIEVKFESALLKRLSGLPIAFITGSQGFWSLNLSVDPCTLIPRQDTESLVEAVLSIDMPTKANVIDLGTGTGAIALALAKERPMWSIMGVDRIAAAVDLAKSNALKNGLEVRFLKSNWLSAVSHLQFDMVVSNPPYVESDSDYLRQGDLRYEPASALSSGIDGLDDIRVIIEQAFDCLSPYGYLVMEHGYSQGPAIRDLLKAKGFIQITTKTDYNDLPRVTLAKKAEPI